MKNSLEVTLSTALISGGCGFMGQHLARALVEQGWDVVVTTRAPTSSHAYSFQNIGAKEQIKIAPLDLLQRDAVDRVFTEFRPERVYHLAADTRVDRNLELLLPQLQANTLAGAHLLDVALNRGVERLIWIGTCEEYGDGPVPFREDQLPRPVSPYSISKLAGSMMAWTIARTYKAPIVVLRPFLTYGPGQAPLRFIPQAIKAALAGSPFPMTPGQQTRDLLYVSDTVAGILAAGEAPHVTGEILNIASGREVRLAGLARLIFELVGTDPTLIELGGRPYREGESLRFFGDPTKARKLLNWSARTPLEEGLMQTIEWTRAVQAP